MKKLDIKRALSEHNMTQADLYQKIGMSPQAICMIIKNNNPTVAKLMQIAEGIGCDITDLFYPDPAEEAAEQEIRDKEMEQEIKKAFESAKDNKIPLEQTLRDLTRRAYPSITEEELKEWVEAITKKKGIVKFDMTPRGQMGLADLAKLEESRKKHEGETLNAEIRGDLPGGFTCKKVNFISDTPGEPSYHVHENGLVSENNSQQMTQTSTFCPHCGKKVRVGVVLLPEE